MKKKIILLFVLLILSGCSAEYNLNIKDDNFYESIDVTVPNSKKEQINQLKTVEQNIDDNLIYKKTIEQGSINTKFNYSHTYSFSEYKNRQNPCFGVSKLYEDDSYYTIIANKFSCFDSFDMNAESYKINIKTDYKIINNNADYKNGNTYTWNYNKNNYKNKSIIFQYSKKEIKTNTFNFVIPIIISLVVALIIFIVTRVVLIFIIRQKEGV